MKFIDTLTPAKPRPLIPVQLTHCLQAVSLGARSQIHRQMFASEYPLQRDSTYTRIGTITEGIETFDIIKCERPGTRPTVAPAEILYFGHWNDGVGTN